MDPQSDTPDAKFNARRRLVRGSFSVPAVLTLASGSSLAATSVTCLAKATMTPSTAPLQTSSGADTFMRVQLLARPENVPGAGPRYLVTRASFGAILVDPDFWLSDTLWQRFNISTNQLINAQRNIAVPSDATLVNYWVALRLNAQGEIVGLGASGSGSVVGSSCWTSIKTMKP